MTLLYKKIISENNILEKKFKNLNFKIGILSNITTNQLENILEYELRSKKYPLQLKAVIMII